MSSPDYIEKLNNKHAKIIKDLQELQAVETYLFNKIQEAANSTSDKDEQNKISAHLKNLTDTRKHLLSSLGNLYTTANDDIDANTQFASNQTVMSQQLHTEIKNAEQEKKKLIAIKNNKQRLAQIGEYEYSKNNEHKSILKAIVYGSFMVLIIVFLNSKEIFPDFLTKIFIVIIVFITVFFIIGKMSWNFKRNNIDYSKFNFPKREQREDVERESTFSMGKLLGLECKDTLEEFSPINTCCSSTKNVFPSNNLNNNTFKNTSLKFTIVN